MPITTWPAKTQPYGMRRSKSIYLPGYCEPITLMKGAGNGFSRYFATDTTQGNAQIGWAYYSNGWRPGYRTSGTATTGGALTDGSALSNVGLLFGTTRGREPFALLSGSSLTYGVADSGFRQDPYQYLPVAGVYDWSISFRLRFQSAITTTGSASTTLATESTVGCRIPFNGTSNTDVVSAYMASYAHNGTNRVATWSTSGGSPSGTLGTTIFSSSSVVTDLTISYVNSTSVATITQTPSSGTAGSVTVTGVTAPIELALVMQGFIAGPYPTSGMTVDNVVIMTGLADN